MAMHTMLNILLASIFVIAVDFAYTALSKRVVYRSMGDSLARLWHRGVRISQSLTTSKLVAQLKTLTGESCPNCLSTNIRRSHRRYSSDKPLSILGFWPYRCSDSKARSRKILGRHFVNPRRSGAGKTPQSRLA